MVQVGDHVRSTGGEHRQGVYRVVGVPADVVLLQVGDDEGQRVSTGYLVRVAAGDLEAHFEPASDPDARFSPVRTLRNVASGLYWSVRRFV